MPLKIFQSAHKTPDIRATIAIAAGKGGVGKSTVTVNIARALQRQDKRVGVLDIDIYGPSLRKLLPETTYPNQSGDVITPAQSHGIKTMSMAYFRDERSAAAVRAPIANNITKQFMQHVNWGELDYLLIDFPPGTGDIQLTVSQQANLSGAIIVTTPQDLSLLDVRKAINLFQQVNVPIIGIIENMSYLVLPDATRIYPFGQGGGKKLAMEYGVPFLGQLQLDARLCEASDKGESIFEIISEEAFPQSICEQFEIIATAVQLHLNLLQEVDKSGLKEFSLKWQNVESLEGGINREAEVKSHSARKQHSQALFIKEIAQFDNQHFTILWSDNNKRHYRLSDLQKHCPCALCQENGNSAKINEDLEAKVIHSVGRYALKIQFSNGCSAGIFDYEMLHSL